jgi:hypothetical protein
LLNISRRNVYPNPVWNNFGGGIDMSHNWTLIYLTGANGQPLAGDLKDFKAAVQTLN